MNNHTPVLFRLVTVPISFKHLIKGQPSFVAEHGFNVHLVSADGPELNDVIQHEQLPHHLVAFTRQITLFQDLKCLIQLVRLFKLNKPAIVHTQTPKAGLLGQLAAWWCNIPVRIHTVGGLPLMETTGAKKTLLRFIEKLTYFGAQTVLPNSRNMLEYMVSERLIDSKKARVLGSGSSNGIDTTFFSSEAVTSSKNEIRQSLGINADAFVFVFIGRLVKDKGINELVEAFKHVNKQHPTSRLLLVGPFEQHLDPLPASTINELNNHPGIIQAGYQSDVRPYLKAADLLCFPSYREGFPNVPMQAGAMSLPMIVSDINGCNEIVEQGKNGWIIPAKNAKLLEEAMMFVLENPVEYSRVKAVARQFITERFEQKRIWEELVLLYKQKLQDVQEFN